MQNVSQAWKDNQNSLLVSESFVDITLTLTDPEAFEDASATDNGSLYLSNTEQTVSEVDKDIIPYSTLEQNLWVLDGSQVIIPSKDNVLPNNAIMGNCTLNDGIYTRKANVYDSILRLDYWRPQAGKMYTIVIDILDDVISSGLYLNFMTDSRFAFEDKTVSLRYGRNYVYVKARENITNDMLGSVWLNSPLGLKSLRFKMAIIQHDDYGDCGYIGDLLSDVKGEFTNEPTVTVGFSKVHTNVVSGVTITWGTAYDDYAVDFTVTAYNGNSVVATKEVTGNTDLRSVVFEDIVNYDCITISISKWCLPYRRARIEEILIGVVKVYDKKDLFSFSHTQSVDPVSASLPKSAISFSVDNSDDSYNPNNNESMAKYLMERQEIKVRYGYKINNRIEWINCGTFYMSEWDSPQGGMQASFSARDMLEFMTGEYRKGVYNPNGTSLYDLAISVLQDAKLPLEDEGTVKWVVDESLKNIVTVAPLPIDTHANCLQMIANAGRCVMYQDRKGVLHIEKLSTSKTDYAITNFNSYSKSEISLTKPLKQVDVSCYNYNVSADNKTLFKEKMSIHGTVDVTIGYDSATNVSATVKSGTLNSYQYYSNICVLNITADNDAVEITVQGNSLESSSIIVSTLSGETGEIVSVNNPLVDTVNNASLVGEWVESYMKNRMILASEWRADPRVDVLDIVENENDYSTNNVIMTSVDYEYNGAFRGKGEGRVT